MHSGRWSTNSHEQVNKRCSSQNNVKKKNQTGQNVQEHVQCLHHPSSIPEQSTVVLFCARACYWFVVCSVLLVCVVCFWSVRYKIQEQMVMLDCFLRVSHVGQCCFCHLVVFVLPYLHYSSCFCYCYLSVKQHLQVCVCVLFSLSGASLLDVCTVNHHNQYKDSATS